MVEQSQASSSEQLLASFFFCFFALACVVAELWKLCLLAWVLVVDEEERRPHMWKTGIPIMRMAAGLKDVPGSVRVRQLRRPKVAKGRNGVDWQLLESCWVRLLYVWD